MRLSDSQTAAIRESTREIFGADATVYLFGSRADDARLGGDIDLYIETRLSPEEVFQREQRLYATLQRRIGPRKIDLIARSLQTPARDIHRQAIQHGIRL
jgi:predicted nucleotidyltransferase